jgi:hypothetical protein
MTSVGQRPHACTALKKGDPSRTVQRNGLCTQLEAERALQIQEALGVLLSA